MQRLGLVEQNALTRCNTRDRALGGRDNLAKMNEVRSFVRPVGWLVLSCSQKPCSRIAMARELFVCVFVNRKFSRCLDQGNLQSRAAVQPLDCNRTIHRVELLLRTKCLKQLAHKDTWCKIDAEFKLALASSVALSSVNLTRSLARRIWSWRLASGVETLLSALRRRHHFDALRHYLCLASRAQA